MGAATSLIELILKKWGDDIAGAAKELEEMVGFPESVANRIATGELPMDEVSRVARREAQSTPGSLFHGSTHDIKEFSGKGNPGNDWGEGTYLTDDVWDASTNYAGEGPDLTNRIESTKEQIQDEIKNRVRYSEDLNETLLDIQDEYGLDQHDMAKVRGWADGSGLISYRGGKFMPDHPDFMLNDESENLLASALTSTIARKQVKGANDGVIYPVRVLNHDGLLNVTDEVELPDYKAQAADELGYDYQKYIDEDYDEDVLYEIEERADELYMDDYDSPNANLFGVGNDLEADMSQVESIYEGDTWNDVRDKLGGAVVETPDGGYIGSGGVAAQVMARGGATGVVDDFAPSRFPSMGAGHHTVIFPGNENLIRSVNAAFDPEYNGPNIMGGAALPITAGLLAAGQSDDADAGFITKGGKTLLEAWHGSPHKFDKFSMDAIGTGEGAQAYGHGLYFADSEDVATGYRDRLSGNSASMYGDLDIKWDGQEVPEAHREAVSYLNDPLVMGEAKTNDAAGLAGVLENIPGYEGSAKWLRDNSDKITATPSGNLYRAEIDVTPESLLDWDKPLSEQSEAVREALSDFVAEDAAYLERYPSGGVGERLGSNVVSALDRREGGAAQASEALRGRGIKGIKYLDGDSRAVGDGTSNYVIFDDSLINIAERGNADPRLLAGTAAGTAGLLAAPMLVTGGKEEDGPRSAREAGFPELPVYKDPSAPLPEPTAGDIGDSLFTILGMPMAGLQGLVRGAYGLLSGEDLVTAAAEANHMMGGSLLGDIGRPGGDTEEGWDRLGKKVTDVTGDETLGFYAKWVPSLFSPF